MTISHNGEAMPAKALTTRRAALASFASAGALIVPTVAAMAASASTTQLSALIEAHRAARIAFGVTDDAMEAARPDDLTLIPTLNGCYSANLHREDISAYIERDFAAEVHKTASISKLSPALGEEVRTLLAAKKASCLAGLEEAFAEHSAARSAWDGAYAVEEKAGVAVCAYRCASIEEAALKAEYLHACTIDDKIEFGTEHIEALLVSFLPIAS